MEKLLTNLTDPQLTGLLRWLVVVLCGLAIWLLHREFARITNACERIPSKEWFEEMKDAMERIPSPEDIQDARAHFALTRDHEIRLTVVEKGLTALVVEHDKIDLGIRDLNLRFAANGMGRRKTDSGA